MRKIFFLLTSVLLFGINNFAQLENANWCFSFKNKVIFSLVSPPSVGTCVNDNDGFSRYGITCASVSDKDGNLLFYSDGVRVWDLNGNIMPGGNDIGGEISTGNHSEQGIIIVPKPGSQSIYYIFTVCRFEDRTHLSTNHGGFHYSLVDMSQGVHGEVTMSRIPLKNDDGVLIDYDYSNNIGLRTWEHSITSTLNRTKMGIWVTIFTRFHVFGEVRRRAYSYLVSANGIGLNQDPDGISPMPNSTSRLTPYCLNPLPSCSDISGASIKISPDGSYLANEIQNYFDLYRFDNSTGQVQFDHTIYYGGSTNYGVNGVEFSPNSQLIYLVNFADGLYQAKSGIEPKNYIEIRQAKTIPEDEDSTIIVGQFEVQPIEKEVSSFIPLPGGVLASGDLQLALNGKIYVCTPDYSVFPPSSANLGVINFPDVPGTGCQYVNNAVTLVNHANGSLPQWVHKTTIAWPKIYEAIEALGVRVDNNGNLFADFMVQNMTNNINHNGPTMSAGTGTTHYTTTTGVTNWVNTGVYTGLPLSGGILNLVKYAGGTNLYVDVNTGGSVTGPSLPANVKLLAQDNDGFIALDGYNLKSYNNFGIQISSIPIATISGYYLDPYLTSLAIYHPSNHRLFVCLSYYNGSLGYIFRIGVYDFNTSTYALSTANTPSNNQVHGPLLQVNNAEKTFIYDPVNQILEEYKWTAITPSYTTLSITNFTNSSLEELVRCHHLVEDKILIRGTGTNLYYYCINTSGSSYSATKIPYTLPSGGFTALYDRYVFEGNNVFITGQYQGTGFTIGSQAFPLLGSNSVFVTKFDLNEFNRPSQQSFFAKSGDTNSYNSTRIEPYNLVDQLQLFPNPAKQTLTVTLTQRANKANSLFFISVTNTAGEKLLTTFSNKYNTQLDISKLKPGLYYVSITTDKRNIVTKAFLKE